MRAPTLLLAALAVTLAACGGSDDPTVDPGTDTGGAPAGACLEGTPEEECEDVGAPTGAGDEPMTSGMCAADQPDCVDTIDPNESGAAGGACLAGDEDCADDPSNGADLARVVPLTDTAPDAELLPDGESDAATGAVITSAYLQDDGRTLSLTIDGGACDVLQDVVVEESDVEVRLLVLAGMDRDVDACTQQIVTWRVDVELSSPLGQRAVADLAG